MKEKQAKKLARKYFKWWSEWLGLRYGLIKLFFVDYIEEHEGDGVFIIPDCAGKCHTDWRYQETQIEISIKKICQLDEEGIERVIVHELMHVFLNEMREEGIDHEERVATNLQKTFFWVREGARKEAEK